jgi:hypothetical protein
MHATVFLCGAIHVVGLAFLAGVAFVLGGWCFLCFRLGLWLARGCPLRTAQRCGKPHQTAEGPASGCRLGRRLRRPSSPVGMVLAILLVCLAVFGLRNSRTLRREFSRHRVSDKAAVRAVEDAKIPTWTVKGHGVTREDADQIAMEAAYNSVLNYIDREMPAPHWTPSPDYVSKKLITSRTTAELNQPGLDPETQQTTMHVEMNAAAYRDILRRGRMLFLAKLVGALILILGTVAVYLRLDDLGKGYFTGWLRLGAVGAIAGVVVGLLSLM